MILSRIYEWARIQPAKTAIIHNDVPLSYAAFARALDTTHNFLEGQNLPAGGTALVVANDTLDAWLLVLGLRGQGLNTICVPSIAEAEKLNARAVACVALTKAESGFHNPNSVALAGKTIVVVPGVDHTGIQSGHVPGPGQSNHPFGGHILYTSGTTGTYKKVLLEGVHEDRRNCERARAMAFHKDTIHHNLHFGLWTGAGFKQPPAAWHAGGCIVFDKNANALDDFYRHGITSAALLPPMVKTLLDRYGTADSSPDRRVQFGVMSGFISLDLAERASRLLTDHFLIRYSATEMMSMPMQSHFRTKDDLHWLSQVNGQTAQVVDEIGAECAAGQEGELRVLLNEFDCTSYMDDEGTSARVFRDGFFYPGDLAVRRADGRIRVLGRTSDVLNVRGHKLAVAPVEQAIQTQLGVEEVCLFSGLTIEGEEELVIAIQSETRPPLKELEAVVAQFRDFDRVRCQVMKAFPRNETGTRKVQRAALKLLLSAERGSSATAVARNASRVEPGVRVVIYGIFSENWMKALAPGAPVWKELPRVREVLIQPDEEIVQIPPARGSMETVIVPLLESHTLNCPRSYRSLMPNRRAVETLGNKAAFAAYAKAQGLAHLTPATYATVAEAVFPCVLKRTDLHSGTGVAIVMSPEHLRAHLAHELWRGKSVVLQALVKTAPDYVTYCLCKDGKILWHCSFSYEMDSPAEIRNPQNSKRIGGFTASPRTLAQIEAFLRPLAYTGPCNVDYKLSETGDILVFEINPRLGGSLMRPEHVAHLRDALSLIIELAAVPV